MNCVVSKGVLLAACTYQISANYKKELGAKLTTIFPKKWKISTINMLGMVDKNRNYSNRAQQVNIVLSIIVE